MRQARTALDVPRAGGATSRPHARRSAIGRAVLALLLMTAASCASAPPTPTVSPAARPGVTLDPMLATPSAADWVQWGGAYDGANHSRLDQIDRSSVSRLAPAWRTPIAEGLSMPTPLVHDGVMFLHTSPDTLLALDAASGKELWRHAHTPADVPSTMKMGVGLSAGRVFIPTSDMRVLALDARTGERIWEHAIAIRPPATPGATLGLRSAPFVVGDKVIQGVTASLVPGGGFIVALDAQTGTEAWRFNTIARPGEAGGESWNGLSLEQRSGGSVWHQGSYDPLSGLAYYGVAPTYDTGPLLKPSGAPGVTQDALYTNSTLALDPTTGALMWSYQHMSNDQWDLDWAFERQLIDLPSQTGRRRAVITVGKMGVLDALDAATGEYLFSIDAGTQNIITAIDPATGRKTIDRNRLPDPEKPTIFCPAPSGARSWPPTSFSPQSRLLYIPLTETCTRFGPDGYRLLTSGAGMTNADHPDALADGRMGRLQAMDLDGRRPAWSIHLEAPISTSVLSTGGGLVFAGDLASRLNAFDDRNGELLWSAPLGAQPSSGVIAYAVNGRQYVAVVTGMKNNHVNDLSRRWADFMRRQGRPPAASGAGAAIEVFALDAPTP